MKSAYILIGGSMILVGGFATIDLITNSGFNQIEKPVLGAWGVLGPAIGFTGILLAKLQGRRFRTRAVGGAVIVGGVLQTLGLLPFVQPRILPPTPGHAGVGLSELLSLLLFLGGMAGFILSAVLAIAAQPEA